jgi:hypothetical protein
MILEKETVKPSLKNLWQASLLVSSPVKHPEKEYNKIRKTNKTSFHLSSVLIFKILP